MSGLTPPRITEETLRTLAAIAHYGEATPAQVRMRTGLASGTVSPILGRLEAAGWLERRNGASGRAYYQIAASEAVAGVAMAIRDVATQLLGDLA